jgi:hypothetical protein
LNNACFQHSIREKSTFISYTIFNKSISINDFERLIYVIKQKTIRVIYKIDNKRTNIFFFDAFYVSKCSLNLINFDQLNEIRCFMSYKSNLFMIKNQDIIIKKRVNNVFFLNCESMWIIISSSHLSLTISSKRSSKHSSKRSSMIS